jgi:hypothetical protein
MMLLVRSLDVMAAVPGLRIRAGLERRLARS